MSYYGSDLDTTETAFDDPTVELEANGEADDPEGDLGDGARTRLERRRIVEIDPDLIRKQHEKRAI